MAFKIKKKYLIIFGVVFLFLCFGVNWQATNACNNYDGQEDYIVTKPSLYPSNKYRYTYVTKDTFEEDQKAIASGGRPDGEARDRKIKDKIISKVCKDSEDSSSGFGMSCSSLFFVKDHNKKGWYSSGSIYCSDEKI